MKPLKSKLFRRGKTYSLRVYIPKSLAHLHPTKQGKPGTEKVRALNTTDRKEAERKAIDVYPDMVREIYQLPKADNFKVRPRLVTVEESVFSDDAKFGDPPIRYDKRVVLEDRHPELDDALEEIEQVHGAEVAKDFNERASGIITLKTAPAERISYARKRKKATEKTLQQQLQDQEQFAEWYPDPSSKVSDVTVVDADDYVDSLIEKGYANKTINRKVSSLSVMWKWAVARGYAEKNIWPNQTVANKTATKKRPLTPEEVSKVRAYFEDYSDPVYKDLTLLLLFTGCRLDEVCSLQAMNITYGEGGEPTGFYAVGGKPGEDARDWIPVVLKEAQDALKARAEGKDPTERLFNQFEKIKDSYAHYASKQMRMGIRKALGLPLDGASEVDTHSLRRVYSTVGENSGISLTAVDRMQRRKTGSIAGDVYSSGPDFDLRTVLQATITDHLVQKYWPNSSENSAK